MTPFASNSVASNMDSPFHDDAPTYTSPKNHSENNRCIRDCAIYRFRESEAIRVIFKTYLPAQPVEGEIAPGVAMPTVPVWPVSFSANVTSSATALKIPA